MDVWIAQLLMCLFLASNMDMILGKGDGTPPKSGKDATRYGAPHVHDDPDQDIERWWDEKG